MSSTTSTSAAASRLEQVVRAACIGFFDWDVVRDRLFLSPEWKGQLGYAADELNGDFRTFTARLHPDDEPRVIARLEAFLSAESDRATDETEFRLRHRDGSWRWIQARTLAERDASGRAVRAIGCTLDVTEHRELEHRLAEQASLLDLVHDAVLVCDLDRRVKRWTGGAAALYGWSESEALGSIAPSLLRTRAAVPVEAIDAHLLATGTWEGELMQTSRDGLERVIDSRQALVRGPGGEPVGILQLNRDVTERRSAERRLQDLLTTFREASEEWASTLDALHERVALVDSEGRIVRAGRRMGESYLAAAGATSPSLHDALHTGCTATDCRLAAEIAPGLRAAFAGSVFETEFRSPGGDREFGLRLGPVEGGAGRARRLAVVIVEDRTERNLRRREAEHMELQLRHAQKLEGIGQLASGIAHEINTPTQFIGDNLSFLQRAMEDLAGVFDAMKGVEAAIEDGTPAREALHVLRCVQREVNLDYLRDEMPKAIRQSMDGVSRVATIVRSMKEFSHPGPRERTATDLHRILENTVTVARNRWKYVADLELSLDPTMPPVPCVPGEIGQVFLNLIINAADAIAEKLGPHVRQKGSIRVGTRVDGAFAEVRVEDTGTGISEEVRRHLFEPFFTTKEVGKGTGQGLAIARSVVVGRHGGELSFESHPGCGTTFLVRLPLD